MKKSSKISIRIPPPVVTIVFSALMLLIDSFYNIDVVGLSLNWLVGFLLMISLFLLLPAAIQFYKRETTVNPLKPENTKVLVVDGVYRYSRNPMYLGMALLLFAWCVLLDNPLNIIIFFGFVFYMNVFQIKVEEEALLNIFGEDFNRYKLKVRRWI